MGGMVKYVNITLYPITKQGTEAWSTYDALLQSRVRF